MILTIYYIEKVHSLQKGIPLNHWKYKSVKNFNMDLYIISNKTGCSRGMDKYYTYIFNLYLLILSHHHIYSDPHLVKNIIE